MTQIERQTGSYLSAEEVIAYLQSNDSYPVTFLEEPHLEESQKFKGKKQYHVKVQCPDKEIRTWTMNGTSVDWLADHKEWKDTKDYVGKSIDVDTELVNTPEGKKDAIYPAEMLEQEAKNTGTTRRRR